MHAKNQLPPLCFPQVVVAQASAGSGKTYALAKRYLQLLMQQDHDSELGRIRAILAITFTNKAMLEMKERILDFLKRIALDAFASREEEKDLLDFLGLTKPEAQERARRIMDTLICHYNYFQVKTIDSFINALLLGCALNIDRSASFQIKKDYRQHLSFCLDLVIEKALANKDIFNLLKEFLQHYLFLERRTGWFPRNDILELIQFIFRLTNQYGSMFRAQAGSGIEVMKAKRKLYRQISRLLECPPAGINANALRHIKNFLEKNDDIFDIGAIPAALQSPEPPMNKKSQCPVEFEKKWKEIHAAFVQLVELDAAVAYNPYILLLRQLLSFFQSITKKEDILFLEELNRKARLLFGETGLSVAELYYRLATRFHHYLIDEFQDTSVLQWKNLLIMVEDALSEGGTLFYVGDKKQAIYSFRGGEVRLFDAVRDGFRHFNVTPVHLLKNWRSQRAIIEFNNRVFSQDNLRTALNDKDMFSELSADDIKEIMDVFEDVQQEVRSGCDGGYVFIERMNQNSRSEHNESMQKKILTLLGELKQRFRNEDIVVLARSNDEVELITSWLLEEKIPVESEKTLNVMENTLIKELIAFLRFIYKPKDNINFAAFILGDIFSHVSAIPRQRIRDFLFAVSRQHADRKTYYLYELFAADSFFRDVYQDIIEYFLTKAGFISVYELMVDIYRRFNLLSVFSRQQAFFMKFLELIKAKEEEYIGLGALLSYFDNPVPEEVYVELSGSDSVKVLTIHKAKGLEFPVVIIPFLRMDVNPETGGRGTSSYIAQEDDSDLRLLRITKTHRAFSARLSQIYRTAYKQACIDELNALYVALTRAQYELYLFLCQRSGQRSNKAFGFIPADITSCGKPGSYASVLKSRQKKSISVQADTYGDWLEQLHEDYGQPALVRQRQQVSEGIVIHAILAGISDMTGKDMETVLDKAVAAAQVQYPSAKDFNSYRRTVKAILSTSAFKDIFYLDSGAEVYCEKEIVNSAGDSRRIDRLIVRRDEILIIDYKMSSEYTDRTGTQLSEYRRIISDIYPNNIRVRAFALYIDKLQLQKFC